MVKYHPTKNFSHAKSLSQRAISRWRLSLYSQRADKKPSRWISNPHRSTHISKTATTNA
jgi:hypothetical protein